MQLFELDPLNQRFYCLCEQFRFVFEKSFIMRGMVEKSYNLSYNSSLFSYNGYFFGLNDEE